MSQIYNTLPPTTGKVILTTNFGNIDIELFCKECPKATRNFIKLCLEGYYNNREFHRIINDFIIQCGGDEDKNLFKDEFHSRIKFKTRGMVACVNKSKPNTNTNQFFITVCACQWLDNKNTIFGRITNESFFNVKAINEVPSTKEGEPQLEKDSRPRVIKADVIVNPFDDIIINSVNMKNENSIDGKPNDILVDKFNFEDKKIINNTNLLSFQDEDIEVNNDLKEEFTLLKKKTKKFNNNIYNNPNRADMLKENDNNHDSFNINNYSNTNNSVNLSLSNTDTKANLNKQSNNNIVDSPIKVIKQPKLSNIIYNNSNNNKELSNFNINSELSKLNRQDLLVNNLKLQEQEEMEGLTALERHKKILLNKASYTTTTSKKSDKVVKSQLDNLKNKLKLLKTQADKGMVNSSNEWISNKLKFHIDSEKAYSLQKLKEQSEGLFN
jgi:cyclophilin family peptidyl-prolyl cis-trans isomerase